MEGKDRIETQQSSIQEFLRKRAEIEKRFAKSSSARSP